MRDRVVPVGQQRPQRRDERDGLVTAQQGEAIYDRLGRVAPLIEIPVAGHHIMLDEPVALAAALRTLLADWDHSIPHR